MGKNPAFPFYANDYLVDTLRWSRGMKSLHVDLMAESWANGRLEDVDGFPKGLSASDKKLWTKIVHKWKLVDGLWINEKLESCRAERERFIEYQIEKGRKSADKRKANKQPEVNHGSTTVQPLEGEEEKHLKNKVEKLEKFLEPELEEAQLWTDQVIEGNDAYFVNMVRNAGIVSLNGQMERLARDHLGLIARYKWHEKMTTQQAFRLSLLGHIVKEINKPNGTRTKGSTDKTGPEPGKDYKSAGGF
jgi:hypothetical protein